MTWCPFRAYTRWRTREHPASPDLAARVEHAIRRIDRVAAELDIALADVRRTSRGEHQ